MSMVKSHTFDTRRSTKRDKSSSLPNLPSTLSSTFASIHRSRSPFRPAPPIAVLRNHRKSERVVQPSKNHAVVLLLTLHRCRSQHAPDRFIENPLQTLLCQRRTLQILCRMNVPCHLVTLSVCDRLHPPIPQLCDGLWVLSQIQLGPYEDGWNVGSVMRDFGPPFGTNVFETGWANEREADEEYVGLRVGQRS